MPRQQTQALPHLRQAGLVLLHTRRAHLSLHAGERWGAKINHQGGAIHVHAGAERIEPRLLRLRPRSPPDPAPGETRDRAYGELTRLSPSARYDSLLVTGENGLLARGFKKEHISNYGALPASQEEHDRLARQLLVEICERFQTRHPLRGVPGYWEDGGRARLWKSAGQASPMLIIPVCDPDGRIQACQMRRAGGEGDRPRYFWLSSAGLPRGTGSGSPIHLNFRLDDLPTGATVFIVEGALKAGAFAALRPGVHVVATAGVAANHDALIGVTRGLRVLIAFDQDHRWNRHVCRQLATLIARRRRSEGTLETTRVVTWDGRAKGVDDAALRQLPLRSLGAERWLGSLSADLRQEVMSLWQEI